MTPARSASPSLESVNLYQTCVVGLGTSPTYLYQFVLSVEISLFKLINGLGAFTVSVAETVFPVKTIGPVAVTALVVFVQAPTFALVTGTEKVQLPFAASVPPLKETEFPPVTERLPELPAVQVPL